MREDNVAVIELGGEGCAGKNLLDAAEDLERRFFEILWSLGFRRARAFPAAFFIVAITNSYG